MDIWGLVGSLVAAIGGGGLGAVLTYRVQAQAAANEREKAANDHENRLIDQLQEELAEHRKAASARATAQDERMNLLEARLDAVTEERDLLRKYAHELRGHIFDGHPPPPPDWPAGVAK